MSKNTIKIGAAFIYNRRQTDNFRTSSDNDEKFEFSVVRKFDIRIIKFDLHYFFSTSS